MSALSPSHFLSLPVSFCLSVFSMFQRPTIHSTTAKGHFPFESQDTHTALVFNSEVVPKGSNSSKDFLCSPCPCVSGDAALLVLKATELFLLVKMCQAPYFQTQGRSALSTDTWDEGKSKGFLPGIRWSILHNAL